MAFGMLLPHHPFSQQLHEAINMVAPMYPNVYVVVGNGFEFSEMNAQYGVRSFPKLMLFTKGHLYGKYRGKLAAAELAEEFARWTKTLPRSYPGLPEAVSLPDIAQDLHRSLTPDLRPANSSNTTKIRRRRRHGYSKKIDMKPRDLFSASFNIFGYEMHIGLPPSAEPIMGSSEVLMHWDSYGWPMALAGVYIMLRATTLASVKGFYPFAMARDR
jgi:hypothetical protein